MDQNQPKLGTVEYYSKRRVNYTYPAKPHDRIYPYTPHPYPDPFMYPNPPGYPYPYPPAHVQPPYPPGYYGNISPNAHPHHNPPPGLPGPQPMG